MRARVFKGKSIKTALSRVKAELGGDAMILATRQLPKSPRDPYSKTVFEIEAAPRNSRNNGPENRRATRASLDSLNGLDDMFAPIKSELGTIKDLISIAGLSGGMQSIMGGQAESAPLFASLLRSGMSEKSARSILHQALSAMEDDRQKGADEASRLKHYVIKECMGRISTRDPFTGKNGSASPYLAAFAGPTGVGKTTTIAKLAAELSFKQKKSVGLISIDNYRIGAFEQLKTYGAIMGLMCVPAFTRDDFKTALKRMRDKDVVLIDTAGHSHWDKVRMDELLGVMQSETKISVHLVLSVTTGYRDMKEAAGAFNELNPETYVFTKTDETKRCGKMMDQVCDLRLPVSMVTFGQRVPEDITMPGRKDLLGIMLGAEQKREQ